MPRYTFENKKTGKKWTDMMMISEMEDYLKKNKHIRQEPVPINIVGGVQGISYREDGGWKDVKQKIAEAHPNSSFAKHHRRRGIKEIKTDQARARARIKARRQGVPD